MVDLRKFRYYTGWHRFVNRERYDALADPWATIRVDPGDVDRFAVVELTWGLGRVRGGDWDRPDNCRSVTDNRMYEGLVQRFEEGYDWEGTVYYEWVADRIEEDGHFRGYERLDAVDERFEEIDDLYDRMREGYRPNRGTVYDDPGDVEYVHQLEPLVLVGRSGEIVWTEGFHRLILARILGIDRIPVYVLRRHERWQRLRDRIAESGSELPPDLRAYADHPDVADVV